MTLTRRRASAKVRSMKFEWRIRPQLLRREAQKPDPVLEIIVDAGDGRRVEPAPAGRETPCPRRAWLPPRRPPGVDVVEDRRTPGLSPCRAWAERWSRSCGLAGSRSPGAGGGRPRPTTAPMRPGPPSVMTSNGWPRARALTGRIPPRRRGSPWSRAQGPRTRLPAEVVPHVTAGHPGAVRR